MLVLDAVAVEVDARPTPLAKVCFACPLSWGPAARDCD